MKDPFFAALLLSAAGMSDLILSLQLLHYSISDSYAPFERDCVIKIMVTFLAGMKAADFFVAQTTLVTMWSVPMTGVQVSSPRPT